MYAQEVNSLVNLDNNLYTNYRKIETISDQLRWALAPSHL